MGLLSGSLESRQSLREKPESSSWPETSNITYATIDGKNFKLHDALYQIAKVLKLKVDDSGYICQGKRLIGGPCNGLVVDSNEEYHTEAYGFRNGFSPKEAVYLLVNDEYIYDPCKTEERNKPKPEKKAKKRKE
jgi:hypothetical protein